MVPMLRYMCDADLLATVEAALAASHYTIEIPPQYNQNGACGLVMRYGATRVLLTLAPDSPLVDIELWGDTRDDAARLLEALPIPVYKAPAMAADGAERVWSY
jgi:hypothetical protein